jgi:hypothetical protein
MLRNGPFTRFSTILTRSAGLTLTTMQTSRIPFFTRSCFYAHARPRLRTRLKLSTCPQAHQNSRQFSSTPPVHYAAPHLGSGSGSAHASSLLTQTLDQRDRMARGSQSESVGPFMIGIQHKPASASDMKKWSELDTKGKSMWYIYVYTRVLLTHVFS